MTLGRRHAGPVPRFRNGEAVASMARHEGAGIEEEGRRF